MAEKLDSKEMVTPDELIYSNMMQIEAITRLLIKKGIISKDELQAEYTQLMREAKKIVNIIRSYLDSCKNQGHGTNC
jgi:hypothetical protein